MTHQHRRLIHARDLGDRHIGRTVQVGQWTGTLTGVLPVGDRVQLALIVGGSRAFSDWLDGGEGVEVWPAGREAS